jgi:hypothetical protein
MFTSSCLYQGGTLCCLPRNPCAAAAAASRHSYPALASDTHAAAPTAVATEMAAAAGAFLIAPAALHWSSPPNRTAGPYLPLSLPAALLAFFFSCRYAASRPSAA